MSTIEEALAAGTHLDIDYDKRLMLFSGLGPAWQPPSSSAKLSSAPQPLRWFMAALLARRRFGAALGRDRAPAGHSGQIAAAAGCRR